jgi:hypothetical protein
MLIPYKIPCVSGILHDSHSIINPVDDTVWACPKKIYILPHHVTDGVSILTHLTLRLYTDYALKEKFGE